jgi:hypothetical protein
MASLSTDDGRDNKQCSSAMTRSKTESAMLLPIGEMACDVLMTALPKMRASPQNGVEVHALSAVTSIGSACRFTAE